MIKTLTWASLIEHKKHLIRLLLVERAEVNKRSICKIKTSKSQIIFLPQIPAADIFTAEM